MSVDIYTYRCLCTKESNVQKCIKCDMINYRLINGIGPVTLKSQ